MHWTLKTLVGATAVLGALAAVGAAYQWRASAHDRAALPPLGELVDVEGHAMHLYCLGEGSPTVVLEQGLTVDMTGWVFVHEAMARTTRVCAYDRPGLGASEPVSGRIDAAAVARNLHLLLGSAGIDGPLVLVGMSAGGVYSRRYYADHPERVVGFVFVDSSHEQQSSRLPEVGGNLEARFSLGIRLCSLLSRIGVIRLFDGAGRLASVVGFPEEGAYRDRFVANYHQAHACESVGKEMASFREDLLQGNPPPSLGELPVVVLSQGKEITEAAASEDEPLETLLAQRAAWHELQRELAALSTRGKWVVAHQSGHGIQFDEPELVVQAVDEVVETARRDARDAASADSPAHRAPAGPRSSAPPLEREG